MGTTADKLSYLNDTKVTIKTSINNFDESVASISDETTFRDYAAKIDANNTVVDNALSDADNVLSDILGGSTESPTAKEKIVDAINNRGGVIETANTWSECADEIKYMDAEWAPDRLWPDIETILTTDTNRSVNGGAYDGAYIVLSFVVDSSDQIFTLNSTTAVAIKTSDGTLYTYSTDGSTVAHAWDSSTYVVDSSGRSCRWIITYQSADSLDIRYASACGDVSNNSPTKTMGCLYVIFAVNLISTTNWLYSTPSLFYANYTIESFDFIESYLMTAIDYVGGYFLNNTPISCVPWEKLPTHYYGGNSFSYCRLKYIPTIIITSLADSFYHLSTERIESITLSSTSTSYTTGANFSGVTYIGYFDMSSVISRSGNVTFISLTNLQHCFLKLPYISMNLSSAINLDFESVVYICDNAPDVTLVDPATTLTLGTTLQTRAGQDNLDKLIAKGWTIA